MLGVKEEDLSGGGRIRLESYFTYRIQMLDYFYNYLELDSVPLFLLNIYTKIELNLNSPNARVWYPVCCYFLQAC